MAIFIGCLITFLATSLFYAVISYKDPQVTFALAIALSAVVFLIGLGVLVGMNLADYLSPVLEV